MDLRRPFGIVLVASLLLASCDIPRDPEKTLDKVTGGTMQVGLWENDPWTIAGDDPGGVEVELVEDFAESLDADIEWFEGSEEDLMGALEMRELDLVIGGLTSRSTAQATFTHPYITTFVAIGVPEGTDPDLDIEGVEVSVEAGTEEAGLLRKTDAKVVTVDDIETATGPRVVDDWLLDDLDLVDTGIRLSESDHVMAVPHGENAWLTKLERFLLKDPGAVRDLLEREGAV